MFKEHVHTIGQGAQVMRMFQYHLAVLLKLFSNDILFSAEITFFKGLVFCIILRLFTSAQTSMKTSTIWQGLTKLMPWTNYLRLKKLFFAAQILPSLLVSTQFKANSSNWKVKETKLLGVIFPTTHFTSTRIETKFAVNVVTSSASLISIAYGPIS